MTPLTEYYNNPGALKPPNGKPDFYEGQFGVDDNGFAIFKERKFGEQALEGDINAKLKRGLNTPMAFVKEYTKGDKPENQASYAIHLAGGLNLKSTDDEFPKDAAPKIAKLITQFESGRFSQAEDASQQQETAKSPVEKLEDEARKLAGEATEKYPEALRVALDVAGASAGQNIGQQAEAARRRFEVESRRMQRATPAAAPPAMPPAQPTTPLDLSRKVPGSSGAANWTRVMGKDIPDVLAESAESMRKSDPRGGQAIIDRDIRNMEKIRSLGHGDYRLSGSGPSQLMLPEQAAEYRAAQAQPPKPSIFRQAMQNVSQGAGAAGRGMSTMFRAMPGLTGALSGLAAAELGQEAYRRREDPIGASIAGMGALGAAASLIPTVPTRLAGPAMAVASPLALYFYDKMSKTPSSSIYEGPLKYFQQAPPAP